jgi:hypothetical protein
MSFRVPEEFRIAHHKVYGLMDERWGNNGAFRLTSPATGHLLNVIASDGGGWEHVSVSIVGSDQTPTWGDMAHVKDLFWEPQDAVMQLHPPHSEYVNNHHGCLHLWRPIGQTIPLPDSILVGDKSLTPEQVEAMGTEGRKVLVTKGAEKIFGTRSMPKRPIPLTRPNIRNGKGLRR